MSVLSMLTAVAAVVMIFIGAVYLQYYIVRKRKFKFGLISPFVFFGISIYFTVVNIIKAVTGGVSIGALLSSILLFFILNIPTIVLFTIVVNGRADYRDSLIKKQMEEEEK